MLLLSYAWSFVHELTTKHVTAVASNILCFILFYVSASVTARSHPPSPPQKNQSFEHHFYFPIHLQLMHEAVTTYQLEKLGHAIVPCPL